METLIMKLDYILISLQYVMDNLIDNFIARYCPLKQKYKHLYQSNKYVIDDSPVLKHYCYQIDNLIVIGDLILADIKNEFKIKY